MAGADVRLDKTIAAAVTAYRGARAAYEAALASLATDHAATMKAAESEHADRIAKAKDVSSAATTAVSAHQARVARLAHQITEIRDTSHRLIEAAAVVYLGGHESGSTETSSTSLPVEPTAAQLSTALADSNLLVVDLAAECWSIVALLLMDGQVTKAADLGGLIERNLPNACQLINEQLLEADLRAGLSGATFGNLASISGELASSTATPCRTREVLLTEVGRMFALAKSRAAELAKLEAQAEKERRRIEAEAEKVRRDQDRIARIGAWIPQTAHVVARFPGEHPRLVVANGQWRLLYIRDRSLFVTDQFWRPERSVNLPTDGDRSLEFYDWLADRSHVEVYLDSGMYVSALDLATMTFSTLNETDYDPSPDTGPLMDDGTWQLGDFLWTTKRRTIQVAHRHYSSEPWTIADNYLECDITPDGSVLAVRVNSGDVEIWYGK